MDTKEAVSIADMLKNPVFHFLLTRKMKQKILKNEMVDKAIAKFDAEAEIKIELENRKKTSELVALLDNIYPLNENFQTRAIQNLTEHAMWQQENREKIAIGAHLELGDYVAPGNEQVLSEDFMSHFYEYASNVSKESARKIWSKVLANEISMPGSFSLFALSALKTMEKDDIDNFCIVAEFLFGNLLFCPYTDVIPFGGFKSQPERENPRSIWKAFERTKALGLTPGPAEGQYFEVHSEHFTNILLRHGRANIYPPDGHSVLVYGIIPHPAFFELLSILDIYHPHLYGMSLFVSEMTALNIKFEIITNIETDSAITFGKYNRVFKLLDIDGNAINSHNNSIVNRNFEDMLSGKKISPDDAGHV